MVMAKALTPRIQPWLGLVLSGMCLILALRNIHFGQVLAALAEVNYIYVLLAMGGQTLAIVATAMRWKVFFPVVYGQLGTAEFMSATFVGALFNTFLPARLGSFLRAYLIGKAESIHKSFAVGTIVCEKLLDSLMLIFLSLCLLPLVTFPDRVRQSGFVAGTTTLVFWIAFLLIGSQSARLLGWAERFSRRYGLLANLSERWALGSVLGCFEILFQPKVTLQLWAWSAVIVALGVGVNFIALLALGIKTSLVASAFLLVVLQLGTKVPALPGNVGVFEYLSVFSLSLFSVNRDLALSFGFLLHLIVLFPTAVFGTFFLWRRSHDRR